MYAAPYPAPSLLRGRARDAEPAVFARKTGGRSKLYELLRSGTIESVRIDRLRRIPIQALHEFVERLREA